MELFAFFRDVLAWSATIACLWPLNIPWAYLAYVIRNGPRELPIDTEELWWRCVWGTLALAVTTAAFIFIDWIFADWFYFPPGVVHLSVFMGYVPAAVWVLTLFFAFTDLLDGLGLFVLYLFLLMAGLWVLNAVTGLWQPLLDYVNTWLLPVTA